MAVYRGMKKEKKVTNYEMMEEKHQIFRSLAASLMTSYLNKDLNVEDDLILWGKIDILLC